jgi:polyisoprenyl-phosphate glycosyltransferase
MTQSDIDAQMGTSGLLPTSADRDRNVPKLSVVIPCYNEVDNLTELHRRVTDVCRIVCGMSYEIILVNDGSRDATWPRIVSIAECDGCVVGLNLSRNYGHQIALSAGLMIAQGLRILVIDADLQDPPELLPQMMERMDAGVDVVFGQRMSRAGESAFKRFSALAFYRLLDRLIDIHIPLDTGDFRLMSRRALDVLNSMPEQHRFIRGMVSWIGLRQEPICYERAARFAGETNYPLTKMMRLAFDAITGFSTQPLRIASYLGVLVGVFAVFLLIYVLFGWVTGNVVEGWTSLMVVVITLTSVQLFVLGIIGEYLGRLFIESKRRPLFVVDEVVAQGRDAAGSKAFAKHRATRASAC